MFSDGMAKMFIIGTLQDEAVREECKTMLADFLKGLGVTTVTLELTGESGVEELTGTPEEAAGYLAEEAYKALGVYEAAGEGLE